VGGTAPANGPGFAIRTTSPPQPSPPQVEGGRKFLAVRRPQGSSSLATTGLSDATPVGVGRMRSASGTGNHGTRRQVRGVFPKPNRLEEVVVDWQRQANRGYSCRFGHFPLGAGRGSTCAGPTADRRPALRGDWSSTLLGQGWARCGIRTCCDWSRREKDPPSRGTLRRTGGGTRRFGQDAPMPTSSSRYRCLPFPQPSPPQVEGREKQLTRAPSGGLQRCHS
jgi:hypothetical protein